MPVRFSIFFFVCLIVFSSSGISGSKKSSDDSDYYFYTSNSIKLLDASISSKYLVSDTNNLKKTSDPPPKPEVGFLKKLFTSATKEEKAAKKEVKILKELNNNKTQIYGWFPYWMNNAIDDFRYNLLTTFSFYCVEIFRDSITNQISYLDHGIDNFSTKDILNKASSAGCRVDLTIMCTDRSVVNQLLNNKKVQDSCIRHITRKLDSNKIFDGVCIVFENMPSHNSGSFLNFLSSLRKTLTPNLELKLALPAKDFSSNYAILKLNALVDAFIIMGYNYYLGGSVPGPVAPLDDNYRNLSIKVSVKEYLNKGVPYNKLIVALPYYGSVWKKKNDDSDQYSFYKHWTYTQISKNISLFKPSIEFDSVLCTNYYNFKMKGDIYKCYYDDSESLAKKYKWLIKQGIAGVGIWALGYDNGSQHFWEMIEKNFNVEKFYPLSEDAINDTSNKQSGGKQNSNPPGEAKPIDPPKSPYPISKSDSSDQIANSVSNPQFPDKLFIQMVNDTVMKKDEKSWLTKKLEILQIRIDPMLSNKKIVLAVIITLIIFGLTGIIASLLFSSVRELLYIMNLPVYFLANAILILTGLGLFSFLNLIKPDLNEMSPHLYALIHKCIWVVLVLCWVLINFLSHKLVGTFSLKHERP